MYVVRLCTVELHNGNLLSFFFIAGGCTVCMKEKGKNNDVTFLLRCGRYFLISISSFLPSPTSRYLLPLLTNFKVPPSSHHNFKVPPSSPRLFLGSSFLSPPTSGFLLFLLTNSSGPLLPLRINSGVLLPLFAISSSPPASPHLNHGFSFLSHQI